MFIYNLCNKLVFWFIKLLNYNYSLDRLNYISKNISKSLILLYICIYG